MCASLERRVDKVTLVEYSEDAHVEGYIGDTLAFSATFFGENEDSSSLKQRCISYENC